MLKLQWKTIPRHSLYEASTTGLIRSFCKGNPRILKPWITRGRLMVGLASQKRFYVHRLVLETFIGPCPEGMEGCHRNGDPTDNSVTNLYWGTRSQNVRDAMRHGTAGKLNIDAVADIRARYVKGVNQYNTGNSRALAEEYGIDISNIYPIVRFKSWDI